MAIAADIGDFVRDDEMMLCFDRNLHVVADNPSVLAARCHRARVRIGERDLPVLAAHHFRVDRDEPDDLLL